MNPLLSLVALTTPLTMAQCRALMVKALVGMGVRADLWIAGGVASSILTVAAQLAANASILIATVISGFFLPLASGTGLQLLAIYVYGVTPPAATFATGNLLLTNTGGGVYTVAVGGYVALGNNGQTYTNTAPFTLGAVGSANATVSIPVQCSTQGSIGTANPQTVTTQVTILLGVTVTNPAAIVGIDSISDAALRQLCLNALGARSVRGVRTAYGYAVQTAINSVTGQPVNINRWSISESSHTGVVTIYAAAPSGTPDPNDVLGVVANIEAVARPNAVTANVVSASVVYDTDALVVYCLAPVGTTTASLQTAVASGLTTFFENYPIGGITAADDQGTITGLLAPAVIGNIGASLTAVGAQLVSVSGYNDYSLPPQAVAGDQTTVVVRIVAAALGTFVSS